MSAASLAAPPLHLVFSSVLPAALQIDQAVQQLLASLRGHCGVQGATCIFHDENLQRGWRTIRLEQAEDPGSPEPPDEVVRELVEQAAPYLLLWGRAEPVFMAGRESAPWRRGDVMALGAPITLEQESYGLLQAPPFLPEGRPLSQDLEVLVDTASFLARLMRLHSLAQQRELRLKRQNAALRHQLLKAGGEAPLVCESRAMQEVSRQAANVAPSRAPVLIQGEPGVGKKLAARLVHQLSDRARGPFVRVNLEDTPGDRLPAELFGRQGGSFPGPLGDPGRIEQAEGGSLYLEQVHCLPDRLQARLLRLMQYGEFERLGSTTLRPANVRLIAGATADLLRLTEQGRFRTDLYYRISVFPLDIPPLRDRLQDLEPLAALFLQQAKRQYGRELHFTPRALEALRRRRWPGNAAELKRLVDRLAILSDRPALDERLVCRALQLGDRPPVSAEAPQPPPTLQDMEMHEVVAALKRNRWVQHRAARELSITPRQMGYRIKKYGLERLVAEQKRKCKAGSRSAGC
ncbi:MAG: sigma 54-interacting transcriptional regulator [Desulfovibrionaceae bacterium]